MTKSERLGWSLAAALICAMALLAWKVGYDAAKNSDHPHDPQCTSTIAGSDVRMVDENCEMRVQNERRQAKQ